MFHTAARFTFAWVISLQCIAIHNWVTFLDKAAQLQLLLKFHEFNWFGNVFFFLPDYFIFCHLHELLSFLSLKYQNFRLTLYFGGVT